MPPALKHLLAAAFIAASGLLPPSLALAQAVNEKPVQTIRFGVLPLGGTVESRALWTPFMADMSRSLGIPVNAYSVPSYEELD